MSHHRGPLPSLRVEGAPMSHHRRPLPSLRVEGPAMSHHRRPLPSLRVEGPPMSHYRRPLPSLRVEGPTMSRHRRPPPHCAWRGLRCVHILGRCRHPLPPSRPPPLAFVTLPSPHTLVRTRAYRASAPSLGVDKFWGYYPMKDHRSDCAQSLSL